MILLEVRPQRFELQGIKILHSRRAPACVQGVAGRRCLFAESSPCDPVHTTTEAFCLAAITLLASAVTLASMTEKHS